MGNTKEGYWRQKAHQKATAIVDPLNGKLVVSKNAIKSISLKYCKDTLTKNEPDNDYSEEIMSKMKIVQTKLLGKEGVFTIDMDLFDFVISKFKKSQKRNYDFLVKAGSSFKSSVFKFCQLMFKEEVFPSTFKDTTLHMVF